MTQPDLADSKRLPDAVVKNQFPSFLLSGCILAFAGLIAGFWSLSRSTLQHIIMPDGTRKFQEVSDPLPVPHALDWNLTLIQAMESMSLLKGPILIVGGALLFGGASWFLFKQIVSPVAKLSVGDDAATPEDESGVSQNPAISNSTSVLNSPVVRFMAIALSVALLVRFGLPEVSQTLLIYYHTMGTFHQGYWLEVALFSLIQIGSIWFATGFALALLLKPGGTTRNRVVMIAVPLIAGALALTTAQFLRPSFYSKSRDWTPAVLLTAQPPYDPNRDPINVDTTLVGGVPASYPAAKELASRIGLKQVGADPERYLREHQPTDKSVIVFLPNQPLNVIMRGCSEDGLMMSPESETTVASFLKSKKNESSLSWIAVKHLYNIKTTQFDLTGATQICIDDMKTNPHLAQCNQTTRDSLFMTSASKANRALLDQIADTRYFSFPTRASLRQMGDLYIHFGDKEEAMKWYLKADMPSTFLANIRAEKPLFHAGHVSGSLILNGKPVVGATVGVFPRRLNALPKDLEVSTLNAARELIAPRWQSVVFSYYHPRPFAFRWVSAGAKTDEKGKFELSELTEGEYHFIVSLPSSIKLQPPKDPKLTISNAPDEILLNYKTPDKNLGAIEMKLK